MSKKAEYDTMMGYYVPSNDTMNEKERLLKSIIEQREELRQNHLNYNMSRLGLTDMLTDQFNAIKPLVSSSLSSVSKPKAEDAQNVEKTPEKVAKMEEETDDRLQKKLENSITTLNSIGKINPQSGKREYGNISREDADYQEYQKFANLSREFLDDPVVLSEVKSELITALDKGSFTAIIDTLKKHAVITNDNPQKPVFADLRGKQFKKNEPLRRTVMGVRQLLVVLTKYLKQSTVITAKVLDFEREEAKQQQQQETQQSPLPPPNQQGVGFSTVGKDPYKIYNGYFHNIKIDMYKLKRGHVYGVKDGKVVINSKGDLDTIDLLTKRVNKNRIYSDLSRKILNKLLRVSGGILKHTKKMELTNQGKKYRKETAKQSVNVCQTIAPILYNKPEDLLDRLMLLKAEKEAGNNSQIMKNEALAILNVLLKGALISPQHYKKMTNNFLYH